MRLSLRRFTTIELLFCIIIIAILFAILIPSLLDSRSKARFAEWSQFSKECSADPTCVVNLNFQEGKGNVLNNSAKAYEGEGFNAKDYNGMIKGDYEWGRGRWWKGKKALQFDGYSTHVELPEIKHINFESNDNFTIMVWIKFDRLRKWDGVFGKCYMMDEISGYTQYEIYFDGTTYGSNQASGEFEADVASTSASFDDVGENGQKNIKLDTKNWFQLTLRNQVVNGKQQVNVFFNGIKLKTKETNSVLYEKGKCNARLLLGCVRWLVREYNTETGKYQPDKNGRLGNFFKGKMDEFLVYNRALTDSEIKAHHTIGADR